MDGGYSSKLKSICIQVFSPVLDFTGNVERKTMTLHQQSSDGIKDLPEFLPGIVFDVSILSAAAAHASAAAVISDVVVVVGLVKVVVAVFVIFTVVGALFFFVVDVIAAIIYCGDKSLFDGFVCLLVSHSYIQSITHFC